MDPATSFLAVNDHLARTKRVADSAVRNAHPTRTLDIPTWLPRSVGVLLAVWLTVSGGSLLVRSLLGATDRLGPGQLVLVAVAITLAAALSRLALAFTQRRLSLRERTFFRGAKDDNAVLQRSRSNIAWLGAVVSLGLLLWALALAKVGSSAAAIGIGWLLFLLEEGWAWRRWLPYFRRARFSDATDLRAASDDRIVQQFTRTLSTDGAEVIRGSLELRIERSARTGVAHLAFCPPFAERPQFDAHFAEPQSATLKVTQLFAHGARLEVRLPQTAPAETALSVRFVARAPKAPAPG